MDTTWNNQCDRGEKSAGFFTAKPVLSQGYHIQTLDKQDTLKGRSQMSHMFTLKSFINKEQFVPCCLTLTRNDCVTMTMFMHQIRFQGDDNARFLGEKSVVINGKRFTHSLTCSIQSPVHKLTCSKFHKLLQTRKGASSQICFKLELKWVEKNKPYLLIGWVNELNSDMA